MTTAHRRIALLTALGAVSIVALLQVFRQTSGTTSLRDSRRPILRELVRRAAQPAAGEERSAGPLHITPLDVDEIELFYPGVGRRMVADPIVYSLLRPNASRRMNLAQYPGGGFEMRTNALGMREDAEPAAAQPDLRILVTGDSHTDGVVPNFESYPNKLEELLARDEPERSIEALNVGVGGYNFYNYLGVPERWEELRPNLLIVGVYGGNDFAEPMPMQRYFERRGPYSTGPHTIKALCDLEEVRPIGGIVSQDALQICYFANNPADIDVCVETVLELSKELRRRCAERGMELLFVYIPPATRGQPERFAVHARVVREEMKVDDGQLAVSDGIADRWMAGLSDAGIECIDMRPLFREAMSGCYWRLDLHINVAGHALIAEALHAHLRNV